VPTSPPLRPTLLGTVAPWVGYLALALLGLHLLGDYLPDDAFIHFRYARNLAAGEGWGYNPGDPSNAGATSPLWVLLLAAASSVLGSVPRAADVFLVVALTVAGGATFAALRAVGRPAAGVVSGTFVTTAPLLLATRGMESPLYVALAATAWWAAARHRQVAAGLALGALTLVRGDGLAVAAGVGLWWLVRDRVLPWRMIGAAIAPVAAWLAYATVVFGDPVPGTLAAKMAQGDSGYWGEGPLFVKGLWELPRAFGMDAWALALVGLGVTGAVTLIPRAARPARRLLGGALLAAVLLVLTYGPVLGVPAYHWYYALPVLVIGLAAGLPIGFAAEQAAELVGDRAPGPARAGGVVLLACSLGIVVLVVYGGLRVTPGVFPTPHYVAAAEFIQARAAPGTSVALTEIGAFGWAGEDLVVVDYLGLLDGQAAEHLAGGDLAWWLGAYEPDWWVVHEPAWGFEQPALATVAFEAYEQVPDDIPELAFYRRRPAA